MADSDQEFSFVDARRNPKGQELGNYGHRVGASTAAAGEYTSVGSMRTRLAAANASLYTTTQLNRMTKNDMLYALRQFDDTAGIK